MTAKRLDLAQGAFLAALGIIVLTGSAMAKEKSENRMRLTEAQCESAWSRANPDNKAKISESEASSYISNMKAVNKDNDGTIERAEFMRACDMGLVKSTATTGESSGTSGSSRDEGKRDYKD